MPRADQDQTHSNACPSYFRAHVWRAQTNYHSGYSEAGYHLAMHAENEVFGDVDGSVIELLHAAFDADDVEQALRGWLAATLPRCIELVPARRRPTFMNGVMIAFEEGRMF